MLSPREVELITSEFPHYADKPALCIEALKVVQRTRGVVSDESLEDIADLLNMPPQALDSVAKVCRSIFRVH